MKVAVIGVGFPAGKKNLPDERLDALTGIFRPPKTIYVQVEFIDASRTQDSDVVLCEENKKLELILQDLEIVEQRILQDAPEKALFLRLKETLEKEMFISQMSLTADEKKSLGSFNLVTLKPITLVKEAELPQASDIIKKVYQDSGKICFFTASEKEVRAWSIMKGACAQEAAGAIHSDIQRGFIKAEVIFCQDLISCGGFNQARGKGLVRLEDKEYVVKDGDIVHFRFSV